MKKHDKFFAITGSLLFATLAAIPWATSYYIFNKPIPILGVAVPFGAYYGYRLIKGKQIDNPIDVCVGVSTLVSLFSCYVIAPIIFIALNFELTIDRFFDTFKWIEVKDELFNHYIWLIVFVLVGIAILYVIYIPYLSLSRKKDKDDFVEKNINSTIADPIDNINLSRPKINFTMIKQIFFSLMIVSASILILLIKDDIVKIDNENHIKNIENSWFTYDIPDKYNIYKNTDSEWLVMKLNSSEDDDGSIMLSIHTVKEDYQSMDVLYNSLLESNSDMPEIASGSATLRSSSNLEVTANGYKYIEFVVDNYRGATHIVDHIIDDSFQYCVIVECTCYKNNKEIMEAYNQIMNTLKYSDDLLD